MTAVHTSVLGPGPLHPAETGNKNACLVVERVRQDIDALVAGLDTVEEALR